MAPDGTLTGAKLVEHHEPIVLVGIPVAKIAAFINGYVGHSVEELMARASGEPPVDIVSGATVSVMVIGDSLTRSAARVLRQLQGPGQAAPAAEPTMVRSIVTETGPPIEWQTLVGDGSVRRLTLSIGEISEAFRRGRAGQGRRPSRERRPRRRCSSTCTSPRSACRQSAAACSATPGGRPLAGTPQARPAGDAGRRGPAPIVQGLGLCPRRHLRPHRTGPGRGNASASATATTRGWPNWRPTVRPISPRSGCSPSRGTSASIRPSPGGFSCWCSARSARWKRPFHTFDLGYTLPSRYRAASRRVPPLCGGTGPLPPARKSMPSLRASRCGNGCGAPRWSDSASLVSRRAVLTGIFFFQDPLVRRPVLFDRMRVGFLLFTLVWLGWTPRPSSRSSTS